MSTSLTGILKKIKMNHMIKTLDNLVKASNTLLFILWNEDR